MSSHTLQVTIVEGKTEKQIAKGSKKIKGDTADGKWKELAEFIHKKTKDSVNYDYKIEVSCNIKNELRNVDKDKVQQWRFAPNNENPQENENTYTVASNASEFAGV